MAEEYDGVFYVIRSTFHKYSKTGVKRKQSQTGSCCSSGNENYRRKKSELGHGHLMFCGLAQTKSQAYPYWMIIAPYLGIQSVSKPIAMT